MELVEVVGGEYTDGSWFGSSSVRDLAWNFHWCANSHDGSVQMYEMFWFLYSCDRDLQNLQEPHRFLSLLIILISFSS